jgi:deazaflavin-dependent oxidoreductase (nitroreductase family)
MLAASHASIPLYLLKYQHPAQGETPLKPDLSLLGDAHVAKYRETDGAVGYEWNGATCLLLTTTGRASGTPRTVPLIYAADGDRCIVVASKGGAPDHPHWYRNLAADPAVQVQVKGDRFAATARSVEGAERERCWALATAMWPSYDDYAKRTTRVIPVVVLDRNDA